MRWIFVGLMFAFGGLSGLMVLRGTQSSNALAVVGGVMIVIGMIRLGSGDSSTDERSVTLKESPAQERTRPAKPAVTPGAQVAAPPPAISGEELERQMRSSRDPLPPR